MVQDIDRMENKSCLAQYAIARTRISDHIYLLEMSEDMHVDAESNKTYTTQNMRKWALSLIGQCVSFSG